MRTKNLYYSIAVSRCGCFVYYFMRQKNQRRLKENKTKNCHFLFHFAFFLFCFEWNETKSQKNVNNVGKKVVKRVFFPLSFLLFYNYFVRHMCAV